MSRARIFFISGRNKECMICHNTRSSICLILRQTVDRVEYIVNNYLGNWLVDCYADSYLEIFRTLRIFLFRN